MLDQSINSQLLYYRATEDLTPFSTPDQYELEVPELQVLDWKSGWHWRFNSLLNIIVISDCKPLHRQTKKSLQNIKLQQHCIRRKDATENLETTKDQLTSCKIKAITYDHYNNFIEFSFLSGLLNFLHIRMLINRYNYPTWTV